MSDALHLVAVSIGASRPVVWPLRYAKMLLHIHRLMSQMQELDSFEVTLRVDKERVSAIGPTQFHSDACLSRERTPSELHANRVMLKETA